MMKSSAPILLIVIGLLCWFGACYEIPDQGLLIRNQMRSEVARLHVLSDMISELAAVDIESVSKVVAVYSRDVWGIEYLLTADDNGITVTSNGPDQLTGTPDDCVLRIDRVSKKASVSASIRLHQR